MFCPGSGLISGDGPLQGFTQNQADWFLSPYSTRVLPRRAERLWATGGEGQAASPAGREGSSDHGQAGQWNQSRKTWFKGQLGCFLAVWLWGRSYLSEPLYACVEFVLTSRVVGRMMRIIRNRVLWGADHSV